MLGRCWVGRGQAKQASGVGKANTRRAFLSGVVVGTALIF